MVVSSPENFARTAGLGFAFQGLKTRHRKKAMTMAPGDRIVYYITGEAAFAATARVASECFEDRTRIWTAPGKPDEDYPWRVKLCDVICPPAAARVPARELKDRLEFVRKWPPEHWRLAFQGHVHALGDRDARLIAGALATRTPGQALKST